MLRLAAMKESDPISPPALPLNDVETKIYLIRGHKVMIDADLASLYGVVTKALNQSVRRNIERFPDDFMFQLTEIEAENLRSQFVTSSLDYGGRRYLPLVFTEYGVAMLSSVLKSKQAIQVNIAIMRAFGRFRQLFESNKEVAGKISELENKYDRQFKVVFDAIRELMSNHAVPRKRVIGLSREQKES
jgi:hypothetical protein